MAPEEFVGLTSAARAAVIDAVLVRNGLEGAHANGAFDDVGAPVLNRLLRQEFLQLYTSLADDSEQHLLYVLETSDSGPDSDDLQRACRGGAAARAIAAFAVAQGLSSATASRLRRDAWAALDDGDEHDALLSARGAPLLFSYIASWEEPELSDAYRVRFSR